MLAEAGNGESVGQSRMREFEELVLLSVSAAGAEAYGVSVQGILEEELGKSVSLGAVYSALDRLAQKGWVAAEMGAPLPVRGGRRRRLYQLTPEGLKQVREVRRVRESLWARMPDQVWEGGESK
jgi:PadR family transcriptional regulator PadR